MKLAMERAVLLKTLTHVQSVVERRNTIPILSNVKLDAHDHCLHMLATDMDLFVVDAADAEVEQEGATTVSAHTLYDIVRKLPEGVGVSMTLDEAGHEMLIEAGRASFTLPCLPASDFPTISDEGMEHEFTMLASDLIKLVDKTKFAISTEETRYYLNGIFLHVIDPGDGQRLRSVATDGHRLARYECALPEGAADMPPVIVPRKTVAELRRLLDETDGEVRVRLSTSRIAFEVGRAVLRSRLIDGTFPDYQRVIPDGNDKLLTVAAKRFQDTVDRVATISTEKSRAIKLSIAPELITVSAVSPDAGRAEEQFEIGYAGENLEIGFNARYVLDITGQIEGDDVEMAIRDAASPTLLRDPGDANVLYVLMPMRV